MGRHELLKRLSAFLVGWGAGTLYTLLVGILVALLVSLAAIYTGWDSFTFGLGPIVVFEFTARTGSVLWATETGTGLVLFSQPVGVLNGLVAAYRLPRLAAQARM